MALVAVAGPAMNFFLAWLAALVIPVSPPTTLLVGAAQDFLISFILFNLVLGLFNLLPIPPLDGGRIVVGVLPLEIARRWARLERAGIVLVLLLILLAPRVVPGFDEGVAGVVNWAFSLILRLAGHDLDGTDVHVV
jgi:Zn-dependent protease